MKVSTTWLKQLIDLNMPIDELVRLLPLRSIGTKEVTEDFIELDMKGYNRADLLSMRGIAYEIASITGSKVLFSEPQEANFAWIKSDLSKLQVEIQQPDLCPFYCLAKIEGLKVNFSDPETVKQLEDNGMRSVNNIADITNIIMLEYGQPLHAFAYEQVRGSISVRAAKSGEELKTLDGKTRKLTPTTLVIADEEKALGVAGVMGGLNSEVTNTTDTILLEAAIFNPVNIRKTTTQLGIPSEASKRFQHGLTKKRLLQAFDAAIKKYESIGGKLTGFVMVGDYEDKTLTLPLTQAKTNSLIGVEISPEHIEEYLKDLNFKVSPKLSPNNISWEVTPPYWRLDINIEEDVIEEVARMYGYEKIPPQELQGKEPDKIDQSLFNKISSTQNNLVEQGLTQVQTYSFFSIKVLDALGWHETNNLEQLIKIANPISSETQYMRNNLWPNLIEEVDRNLRQGFKDIAIFEIGKIYTPNNPDQPKEEYRLSIALMNGSDNPIEELITISKILFSVIPSDPPTGGDRGNLDSAEIKIATGRSFDLRNDNNLFHPTRHAQIVVEDKQIGVIAEVHPKILDKFGIQKRVAVLEIII